MGDTVADVLERAADLLSKPGAWAQGVVGRDANGVALTSNDIEDAVCFCAAGAIWKAGGQGIDVALEVFPLVRMVIGGCGIGSWNDRKGRTKDQVVSALKDAAALAREQGK